MHSCPDIAHMQMHMEVKLFDPTANAQSYKNSNYFRLWLWCVASPYGYQVTPRQVALA